MFEQLKQKETLWGMTSILLGVLSVLAVVAVIGFILKFTGAIGQEPYPTKTITVEGEGKVMAVPDLATISFTVQEEKKDISATQDQASIKANAVIEKLQELGIDEKDLKTTYYNISPRYEMRKIDPSCTGYVCDQTQVVIGYSVTQTVQVKVRETENIGKVLALLGSEKVTDFNGPNLTIDEDEDLQNEAKLLAIADARAKAKDIAKGLNVGLGKLISYYENSGGYPMPYAVGGAEMDAAAPRLQKVAPNIPVGENEIVSHVTLTYKIR